MTKEELATERNEVREILEGFSEELSQSNLNKLSRVFCIINGDEKRIAELEAQIKKMQDDIEMEKNLADATDLEKENAELKKENQKWKDEWQEQVQKATDEGYARTLQTMQLTKAKEILKAVVDFYPTMTATIFLEAEQFLSEVEK